MSRPTGREDRHATQSTANLRVTSKFIFKDCEKRGRTRAAQPRTEVGLSEARSEDWALPGGWLTSAAVVLIILKIA